MFSDWSTIHIGRAVFIIIYRLSSTMPNHFLLRSASFVLLCLLLVSGGGCRPAPQPLTGTVTYDGQPLSKGIIVLTPDSVKGERKLPTQAGISEGKFSIPAKFGVFVGEYSITIEEPEITVPTDDSEEGNASTGTAKSEQDYDRIGFPTYTMQHVFAEGQDKYHLEIDIPKTKETRKRRR